jgi:hypothetical protein
MVTVSIVKKGRGRYYKVDGDPMMEGERLPSVTTILNVINKPALVPWAKKITAQKFRDTLFEWQGNAAESMEVGSIPTIEITDEAIEELFTEAKARPDVIRDEAGDYGTRVHEALATQEEGAEDKYPGIQAYYEWLEEQGLEIKHREVPVYNRGYGYGGTLDAVGYRTGSQQPVILDYKTSSGIYWETSLQIAAYAFAWDSMTTGAAGSALEGWALRFPKVEPKSGQGFFEAKKVADLSESFDGFLAAKGLWEASKRESWAVMG